MDLPSLFSNTTKVKTTEELVLFVILSDTKIQVLLLELSRMGVKVLDKSKELGYEGLDKCVEQTDLALQQLNKKSENVSETIFAVNTSWVNDGEVVDEKKPFFKKLSEDLNLKPLGFIDVNEALSQQKLNENSLFSGILVVFTEAELVFTLIYQGKVKKTEVVGRSVDFKSDFTEGIARVKDSVEKNGNYLPQKILLASFDLPEREIHEYQQEIYDHDWKENSSFLQPPTVEVVSDEKILDALANEAGRNAAVHKGLTEIALAASMVEKEQNNEMEFQVKSGPDEVKSLDSEELGFTDPLEVAESKSVATSFGIPIGMKDLSDNKVTREDDDNLKAVEDDFMSVADDIVLEKSDRKDWGHKKNIKLFAGLGFGLGLLFLVAGLILGSSFISKTNIDIVLNKKLVSKDIKITLDTKAKETDVENLVIAASTTTKKASDTNTIQTTGIKIVGEKAKGKVTIYNKTEATKVFEKGTQLKFGDLIFELDENVTVASASGKQDGKDYGKLETTITAAQIGAESNLEKNKELVIASYDTSTYNAFVVDGLSGGSSREVRVVSQNDLDELLTDLKNELIEKINKEFVNESGDGKYILPSKSIINETSEFDAKVEDESESVSLNLEIEIEAVTYSGADLKPVAQEILAKDLPDNYELEDNDPQILSSPSQTDLDKLGSEAVVSIEANISSYAIPKLSEEEIKEIVLGKSFDQAKQDLVAKEEVKQASFSVIPKFLNTFVKKVASSKERIMVNFAK